MFVCMNM